MRLFVLLTAFLLSPLSWADCAPIKCYDPCSKSKITLKGDRCSITWVEADRCFAAYAECGASKKCLGVSCYDSCTDSYHYFKKGNDCQPVYDGAKLCWTVAPVCN